MLQVVAKGDREACRGFLCRRERGKEQHLDFQNKREGFKSVWKMLK